MTKFKFKLMAEVAFLKENPGATIIDWMRCHLVGSHWEGCFLARAPGRAIFRVHAASDGDVVKVDPHPKRQSDERR